MTLADLANYRGEWVTPASTTYHDRFTVYGTRAPSPAWGIVEAMNVLEACVSKWRSGQTLASLGPANPLYWHALIEAKKVVYADLYRENADPNVKPNHASAVGSPNATGTGNGDTIYLAAADRWGNMVSWINSNFAGWGSGITVPGYGFILHNRGGLFTLDPNSPNVIAPQKR